MDNSKFVLWDRDKERGCGIRIVGVFEHRKDAQDVSDKYGGVVIKTNYYKDTKKFFDEYRIKELKNSALAKLSYEEKQALGVE